MLFCTSARPSMDSISNALSKVLCCIRPVMIGNSIWNSGPPWILIVFVCEISSSHALTQIFYLISEDILLVLEMTQIIWNLNIQNNVDWLKLFEASALFTSSLHTCIHSDLSCMFPQLQSVQHRDILVCVYNITAWNAFITGLQQNDRVSRLGRYACTLCEFSHIIS